MKKGFLIAVFFLLCHGPLIASTIVDTGPGQGITNYSLSPSQWLAGEFELDQDYYITGVYGWIARDVGLDQALDYNFTISIYPDGGDTPSAIGSHIYSKGATISGPNSVAQWAGYEIEYVNPNGNVGLFLPTGEYWVAFEVRDPYPNRLSGHMPGPPVTRLYNYARISGPPWVPLDGVNFGLRVFGTPSAIPEPATMLLFGVGLIGLAGVGRRKK